MIRAQARCQARQAGRILCLNQRGRLCRSQLVFKRLVLVRAEDSEGAQEPENSESQPEEIAEKRTVRAKARVTKARQMSQKQQRENAEAAQALLDAQLGAVIGESTQLGPDDIGEDGIGGFTIEQLTAAQSGTKDFSYQQAVTTDKGYEPLMYKYFKGYGRSNHGHGKILTQHRGGGKKYKFRKIDFVRDKVDCSAEIEEVEWDPWRSAKVARLKYEDGERRYILYPAGARVGDPVTAGLNARVAPGNCIPLSSIPVGTFVHNVELVPGKGGRFARSAGMSCVVLGRKVLEVFGQEVEHTILKMPSKEVRMVPSSAWATIGIVGQSVRDRTMKLGKAGARRWLGQRPSVRGSAMNAVDHRHGGGKDAQSLGIPQKWLGRKTRQPYKNSWKLIMKRRRIGYGQD